LEGKSENAIFSDFNLFSLQQETIIFILFAKICPNLQNFKRFCEWIFLLFFERLENLSMKNSLVLDEKKVF